MSWGNILVVVGCGVVGYAIVSVLMKTSADDLRPPSGPRDPPPPGPRDLPPPEPRNLPPPAPVSGTARRLPAPSAGDWSLLLDIPRSSGPRDIEAAFRRQNTKAAAAGDSAMVERLRLARDAGLAEVNRGQPR